MLSSLHESQQAHSLSYPLDARLPGCPTHVQPYGQLVYTRPTDEEYPARGHLLSGNRAGNWGRTCVEDVAVRKAHLLIIEDSAEIRETLELVLTEEGYDVSLAPDLSRAFAVLNTQAFDLVLTDLFTFSQVDPLQSVSQLRTRVAP